MIPTCRSWREVIHLPATARQQITSCLEGKGFLLLKLDTSPCSLTSSSCRTTVRKKIDNFSQHFFRVCRREDGDKYWNSSYLHYQQHSPHQVLQFRPCRYQQVISLFSLSLWHLLKKKTHTQDLEDYWWLRKLALPKISRSIVSYL